MAKNNIATNLTANSNGFVNAIQKANASLATHNKALHRSRVDFRQFTQNAIFGVEDVMSVIGTSGLSGAIRAASNNVTMMAMALGGTWGMAAGVAISTGAQLMMMFDDTEEKARAMREEYEKWKGALRDTVKYGEEQIRMTHRLRDAQSPDEVKAILQSEQDRIEVIKQRIRKLDEERQYQLKVRDAAQAKFDELDRGPAFNLANAAAEAALYIPESIFEHYSGMQAAGLDQSATRYEAEAERKQAEEQILEIKEQQLAAQRELHQAEINTARAKHELTKRTADEQARFNQLVQSGAAGSKAFAESMAKHAQQVKGNADALDPTKNTPAPPTPGAVDPELKAQWDARTKEQRQKAGGDKSKERFGDLGAEWDVFGNEQRQASSGRMGEQVGTRDPVSEGLREAGKQPFKDFMRDFGTPENPEQAGKLRQYQMQMRDKSPEFHKTMEEVYKKRAELEKKREATREEKETASNTAQTTELLRALVDRMPETQEGAFPS